MKRKKIIFTYLWLAPATLVFFTLASYRNDLDNDGALKLGFPETFFSKSYGMNAITGQIGVSSHFYKNDLLVDIGFSIVVAAVLLILYVFLKRKVKHRSQPFN